LNVSQEFTVKRVTAPEIRERKGGAPIVALTAYHAHTARIIDPHVDLLLVGDSLGMVMHGYETTVPVPLDLMIMHAQAVVRGSSRALVVVDMPFGSYEESPAVAFRNAARVLKETGCGAVKLEGGVHMAETVRYLAERGIPVMSHIGLTPQAINSIGSFQPRGRFRSEWAAFEEDARAIAEAGAFAVVLEALAELLAARITKQIPIPTIGIGASAECDGQILVLEDMLGLSPRVPKFVKEYAQIGAGIEAAVKAFAADVRTRAFPSAEYTYPMFDEPAIATKKTKMTGS
jgi:3-methyl-2-oxobutanoate hydroxymethyltransferase